jgi:hypothetical protein
MANTYISKLFIEHINNLIKINENENNLQNINPLTVGNCISSSINITWETILENPNIPWNWREVSRNPNITIYIIMESIQNGGPIRELFMNEISLNPSISILDIQKFIDLDWDYYNLSSNQNIKWEYIEDTMDSCDWNWKELSAHTEITIEIIKKHINKDWNWRVLIAHPNIYLKDILKTSGDNFFWPMEYITENPNIKWNEIKDYMDDLHLSWYHISKNKNITWDIIQNNPYLNWSWDGISQNPNIKWENVINYLSNKWYWVYISKHDCINEDIIKNHPNIKWNYKFLSLNKNISFEYILHPDNINKGWCWNSLSIHPKLSWDIINNNTNIPWNIKLCIENEMPVWRKKQRGLYMISIFRWVNRLCVYYGGYEVLTHEIIRFL